MKYWFIFLIFFLIDCILMANSLQCKDHKSQVDVDWFILYKLPKTESNPKNSFIKSGEGFLVATSLSPYFQFFHDDNIDSEDSILGKTLSPLYQKKKIPNLQWILYNDQPPNHDAYSNNGHAKGVLLFNESEGIWLVHSVPHFPPNPDEQTKFKYPESGLTNGQTILCISIQNDEFDNIGKQLMYNEIHVFSYYMSKEMASTYSYLKDAAEQIKINDGTNHRNTKIISKGGLEFYSFAKSPYWGKDLYADFVAPILNANLYTETWMNEADKLSSFCEGKFKVFNVKMINFKKNVNVLFNNSHDHSKWAISGPNSETHWICISDINRAKSQFKRGGGAICQKNNMIWQSYTNLVKKIENCNNFNIQ